MSEKSFVVPLGDSDKDRYRLYCVTERGQVMLFRVQYEAYIKENWHAIVRYDTAHGFPHRDLLHPEKPQEKTRFAGHSASEVLTLGQEDIRQNWRKYRAKYEQEMSE